MPDTPSTAVVAAPVGPMGPTGTPMNPDDVVREGWLNKPADLNSLQQRPPNVADNDITQGNVYAYERVYKDGRRVVDWYKRKSGPVVNGVPQDQPLAPTKETDAGVKAQWDKDVATGSEIARKGPTERNANGRRQRLNPQTQQWEDIGPAIDETAKAGQQTYPSVEGTPTGRKNPDGSEIYDNSQPVTVNRDVNTRQQVGPAVPLSGEPRLNWERDKNEAAGLGRLTDAEVTAKQQTGTTSTPLEGYPGWVVKVTKTGNDTKTTFIKPDGSEGTDPRPGSNRPQPIPDGKGGFGYWDTSQPGAPKWTPITGGPQAAQTPIPDGKGGYGYWDVTRPGTPTWVPIKGGPSDTPTGPLPTMRQVVVGASQDALRDYQQQLQEGVEKGRWSQQWANQRWTEAVQIANVASQDAATQQRESESTRNAQIDLAQSRATLGQNAIKSGLDLVASINGKLPAGSPLGGQAFAALLGIQMLSQARSGIDTIDPRGPRPLPGPGSPAPAGSPAAAPLPTVTPADLESQETIAAKRAEVERAQAEAAAAAAAAAAPGPAASAAPDNAAVPPAGAPSRTVDTQPGQPMFPTPPTPAGVGSRVVDTDPNTPAFPTPPTPAGVGSRVVDTDPGTPMMPTPPVAPAPVAPAPAPVPAGPFSPPDAQTTPLGIPSLPGTPITSAPGPFTPPDARTAALPVPSDPPMTIRERSSGQIQQLPLSQINSLPDNSNYDMQDPNTGVWVPIRAPGQPAPTPPPVPAGSFTPPDAQTGVPGTGTGWLDSAWNVLKPYLPGQAAPAPSSPLPGAPAGGYPDTGLPPSSPLPGAPAGGFPNTGLPPSSPLPGAPSGGLPSDPSMPGSAIQVGVPGGPGLEPIPLATPGSTVIDPMLSPAQRGFQPDSSVRPGGATVQQRYVQPAYPAAYHARVRNVAPWMMSPDEIRRARAAGVPEQDIWAVPGSGGVPA